jgi:hypothetical protein
MKTLRFQHSTIPSTIHILSIPTLLIKGVEEFSEPGWVIKQNITEEQRCEGQKKDEKINRHDSHTKQYAICLTHDWDSLEGSFAGYDFCLFFIYIR